MLQKLLFIFILSSIFTHSYSQCLLNQKILLLQLKNELIFNSSISTKLVQWNQSDECCKWYGVGCDAAGYVVSLQLNQEAISGGIGDSSSLFRFMHLKKLNLASNDFNYTPIPRGIRNLTYLTHLNLSTARFGGQLPTEISSLRRLVSLDVSNEYTISVKLEMLVQNLTGLRELYLDYANVSSHESGKWSHIISSYLPNLTTLSMVNCGLSGPFARSFSQLHSLSILRLDYNNLYTTIPVLFANVPSLTTLSLVGCGLRGSFPYKIFHIHTLENLDLSYNGDLNGIIPPFAQIGSLKSILLSYTNFSGLIPSSIGKLKTLSEIDLSRSQFTGSIPATLANLTQLIYVDLSYNFFTGSLSSVLFEGLPNLFYVDLRGNILEGEIPDSFFQLQSLECLFLSGNSFDSALQLHKFHSLTHLTYLDLSGINLLLHVGYDNSSTHGLLQLQDLRLASCNLYDFPDFIRYSHMRVLDLSNNHIVGKIPCWIWGTQLEHLNLSFNLLTDLQKPYRIPSSLRLLYLQSNQLDMRVLDLLIPPSKGNRTSDIRELDLSNNRITGEIPSWIWKGQLSYLKLANNSLGGPIPTSVCNSVGLNVLDLSVNKLSGSMPSCLLDENMTLSVLDLGRNNISGRIPDKFSINCNLQYFDLNNNTLEGPIPKSLERCNKLQFMNVGNNIISDTFPCMLSSSLYVLVLHSNRFHGEVRCHKSWPNLQILDISSNNLTGSLESINFSSWKAMVLDHDSQFRYNRLGSNFLQASGYSAGVRITMKGLEVELVKIWPDFTAVDFSCNNFRGEIPNAIGDLSSLRLLNISHNAINGSIPKTFDKLVELESLDLSGNQLTGLIPKELAGLTFLSFLNLSYNKLDGMIPNGHQLQTFSADSFKGNPGLCGLINLNVSCTHIDDNDVSPSEHENVEEKGEIEWEYVSVALGLVVGLGSIVWLLLFCRSFRDRYFDKIEEVAEEILDRRKRRRRSARRVVNHQDRRQ